MIVEYNKYNERSCISFDFDGVLHLSMIENTIHPADWLNWDTWIPSPNIHQILKNEHRLGNKIIVISARCDYLIQKGEQLFGIGINDRYFKNYIQRKDIILHDMTKIMSKFFKKFKLPVDEIILTNGDIKRYELLDYKAIKHYDDNIRMKGELKNTNIDFIYVRDDKIIKIFKND